MHFEFGTAARVVFGPGTLHSLKPHQFGQRAFVVGGRSGTRLAPLLELLKKENVEFVTFGVEGEPTIDTVSKGVEAARQNKCDLVIGMGGGSAIDAAKAIAGLFTNSGELLNYLEVIGRAESLAHPGLPFIAIPTTAGAGAEATRNAVIASPQHQVKASLRSPFLFARLALVDPELTRDLPRHLTASTGMDALTQVIEPYVSVRANPMTDSLCIEAIPRAARSLKRACEAPGDVTARTEMSLVSLFSGMSLANAGLGAVHGFAAAIGGMFTAPHGAVCAALLPHVMEANIRALQQRAPGAPALARYGEIGRLLTGREQGDAADGVVWVRKLCRDLEIPPLSSYGVTLQNVPSVCAKAAVASSMKANPLPLTEAELHDILFAAI